MPIRRRAIDNRAEAVRAAEAARASAEESYRAGRADLEAVLSSMAQLSQQRRLLIGSVCEYNDEIADYVISVVARPADVAALVTMLIKPSRPIAQATTPGTILGQGGNANRPTLAPPQRVRQAANDESTVRPANPRCFPWSIRSIASPPGRVSARARHRSTAPPIAPREPPRLDGTREPRNLAPIRGLGEPAGAAPPSGAVESEAPKLLVVPVEPATDSRGATTVCWGGSLPS